ncbi:MAG TPA: universal stress protein [Deinococcales bacterium]|nr:universal stress protein [Deinococcales bacterium]
MYRVILVPVDHSPCSARAARQALDLSRLLGSRVTLAHVLPDDPNRPESARAEAQALLERLAIGARYTPRLRLAEARGRSIPEAIVDLAHDENADLILIGTNSREGLQRLVLGSVAQAVAARATVPVQIVPAPQADAGASGRWLRAAKPTL